MRLNESPSKKEGKLGDARGEMVHSLRLNESPSKKEGKFNFVATSVEPSSLNESPSKKEGKSSLMAPKKRE